MNPYRTIPVIIDAGCFDDQGNTAHLKIRDHPLYTGLKKNRVTHKSAAGTVVNSAYYGPGNVIEEFMQAATDLFGKGCLLQVCGAAARDAGGPSGRAVWVVRALSLRTSTRTTRSLCSPSTATSSSRTTTTSKAPHR